MQQIPFIDLFIDLFESALHVSGDKLAHLQEHFMTVYKALVCTMHRHCCRTLTLLTLYYRERIFCVTLQTSLISISFVVRITFYCNF